MKCLRPMVARAAIAGAGYLLCVGAAYAQSVSFGPDATTVRSSPINYSLAVPSTVIGDGTLNVSYAGDLDSGSESIAVSIDGTTVATLNGGSPKCATFTQSITIPAAQFATFASDGQLNVTFQPTTNVGPDCGVTGSSGGTPQREFDAPGPFAGFNGSPLHPFAVAGSVAYVVPPSGPGPSGGSAASATAADADALGNRGALIMASGLSTPFRVRRLIEGSGVTRGSLSFGGHQAFDDAPLTLDVSRNASRFSFGSDIGDAMVWAEGRVFAIEDTVTDDARFAILHIGADWKLSPDIMIGMSVQLDGYRQDQVATGDEFSGKGWMIGPLLTARLGPDLFFDARLAFGQADNEVGRSGGVDQFDSDRALVEMELTGKMNRGDYTIWPAAELFYYREEAEDYSSATLGAVEGAEAELGQLRLGALVERPFEFSNGEDALAFVEFDGVYTHQFEGSPSEGSFIDEIEGFSAEFKAGTRYVSDTGMSVDTAFGVGGLLTDAESYSFEVMMNIPTR